MGQQISAEESDMLMAVERGFLRGDLLPFADYLNAGYPLDDILRKRLIEAIRGSDSWHPLKLKKKARGPGDMITWRQREHRDWEIWDFVQRALRSGNVTRNMGGINAAIIDAAAKYRISYDTAKKAYLTVERRRKVSNGQKDTSKSK